MHHTRLRILFICSRNQWRSPTAERIYRKAPRLDVRSAGTASAARRKVRPQDLEWADLVVAMEHHHLSRLRAEHPNQMQKCETYVLDIPDEYRFMDPGLIEQISAAMRGILQEPHTLSDDACP